MRDAPSRCTAIIFQDSVRNRQMLCLQNVLHMEPVRAVLTHNEPHCVCSALPRQSRACMCVPEIAALEFFRAELNQFASRRSTTSVPSCAEWQARRMRQREIVGTIARGKERTGHFGSFVAFYSHRMSAPSTGFPLSPLSSG